MQFDTNGWLDVAIEVDYLNKSMSRQGHAPTHLVLHSTAGGTSAEGIANYFATSDVAASAHFVIGTDGKIAQGIPCSLAAWANGILLNPRLPFPNNINPNLYTISIEHCKASTDNSDQLTEPQKQSSFRLVKVICEHYGIAKKRGDVSGGIVSHADFDNVNRSRCPGPYPWDELMKFLASGGGTMAIPTGWTDANNVLTAPNGVKVVQGFRDWVLNHPWDPNNYPLEPEHSTDLVEQSNPALGNGVVQTFRLSRLIWTATRNVYVSWIGQEYLYISKQQGTASPHAEECVKALKALKPLIDEL